MATSEKCERGWVRRRVVVGEDGGYGSSSLAARRMEVFGKRGSWEEKAEFLR